MIPARSHQSWKSTDLPPQLAQMRRRLVTLHPGWVHRLSTDEQCRQLVADEAPHLLDLYDGFPRPIQRFDLWRVVAVYVHGGFYVDLDVVVEKPLDELRSLSCVMAEEKTLDDAGLLRHGHPPGHGLRIANYMFGAEPGHPFLAAVLEEMLRSAGAVRSDDDVLETTGPGLVTQVFHGLRDSAACRNVTVLPSTGAICRTCRAASCHFGSYAAHLHMGSWRT